MDFSDHDEACDTDFMLTQRASYSTEAPQTKLAKLYTRFTLSPEDVGSFNPQFMLSPLRAVAAIFIAAEINTFFSTGETLLGRMTGGVVESLREGQAAAIRWHIATATPMWTLGFCQIFLKRLRHGQWAWVHRASGRIMLLLWFFGAGPTAAYLGLFCASKPAKVQKLG